MMEHSCLAIAHLLQPKAVLLRWLGQADPQGATAIDSALLHLYPGIDLSCHWMIHEPYDA
jgi:hypothetical protein